MDGERLRTGAPAKGMAAQQAGLSPGEGGQLGSEREVHCAVGILAGRHSADTGERWEPFLLCVREYQSECPFLMAGDSR